MLHPSEPAPQSVADIAARDFDDFPVPVYATDADGRVTYFNPACVEFAGHAPKVRESKWCVSWRLATPDGSPLPHDACPMAVAVKERRSIRGATAYAIRPDGGRRKFMPFPTPLFDEKRRFVGAINMLAPEEVIEEGEAIWSEVQARLYKRSLARSNDAAMAMISHELRQPLAAAENYLSAARHMLAGSERTPQIGNAIDRASQVLRRLSHTLDGMRTTISKGVLARRRHSLQSIVQSAVALSSTFLPVRPYVALAGGNTEVRVSALQIEQVIMNLLKNAADAVVDVASPEIAIEVVAENADYVQIDISDNGCGFALSASPDLIAGRSTKEGGEGIGLSLAHSIIAHHGGQLWVRRTSHQGTTMSFTLPIARGDEPDDPEEISKFASTLRERLALRTS